MWDDTDLIQHILENFKSSFELVISALNCGGSLYGQHRPSLIGDFLEGSSWAASEASGWVSVGGAPRPAREKGQLAREIPTATCVRHFLPSTKNPSCPGFSCPTQGPATVPTQPCHARNRDQSWTEVRTGCCFSLFKAFCLALINIQSDYFDFECWNINIANCNKVSSTVVKISPDGCDIEVWIYPG